jgi:O-antigen/teichoic acid export membrane protein
MYNSKNAWHAYISQAAAKLLSTGFFYIFGSNTLNQFISFAYGILIVRVMSKIEYGTYGYASNIYSIFLLLSGFGIVSAVMQMASEQAKDSGKISNFFQYGYRFGVKFNAILSLSILIISLLIPFSIEGSNILFGIMFLLPVLSIVKDMQMIWLRVNLKNKAYGTVNTINALLISIFTILGAWLFQAKGIVISHYLVSFFMIFLLWKYFRVPSLGRYEPLSGGEKKDLFQIAGISCLNNTLSQLLALLGTFMLGLVVADANVIADYKVASVIPMAMNFIPSSLMVYLYPYFARNKNDKQWVKSRYRTVMIFAGAGNLMISLLGILLAELIIRIIFGAQYLGAVLPFRVMMLSYFISGTFRTIPGNLLVTQRRLKVNLANGMIGGISTILLNAILIPRYGSLGAAMACLITMIVTGLHYTSYFVSAIAKIGK